MRYSLKSLLLEEYYVEPSRKEPEEYEVEVSNKGYAFISFKPDIGRFRFRGWLWYPEKMGGSPNDYKDLEDNGKYFESLSSIEQTGNDPGNTRLLFKLPGDPMTSDFDKGDRTSVANAARQAVQDVFDGGPPANESWQDIVATKHIKDRLQPTPSGMAVSPPRMTRDEKQVLMDELGQLQVSSQQVADMLSIFPGQARNPAVANELNRISARIQEISRLLGKT
jgi:hypothetical protein